VHEGGLLSPDDSNSTVTPSRLPSGWGPPEHRRGQQSPHSHLKAVVWTGCCIHHQPMLARSVRRLLQQPLLAPSTTSPACVFGPTITATNRPCPRSSFRCLKFLTSLKLADRRRVAALAEKSVALTRRQVSANSADAAAMISRPQAARCLCRTNKLQFLQQCAWRVPASRAS
jgi:hypothetical protein